MSSLSKKARVAGLLFFLASAVGLVRLMYIPKTLIVDGNASATASNIAAHESLFRFGIVAYLIAGVLWIFIPLALYRLFREINRSLAVVMVILGSLMQTPLFIVNTVTDAAALRLVSGVDFLSVIDKPQREALAMLSLEMHHHLDLANSIFWGLWLFPFGMLVYRSRFLPRFFGVWLMLACFAWLTFSTTGLLFPAHTDTVFRITQPVALGEVVTMLWLLVMGAKEQRLAAKS